MADNSIDSIVCDPPYELGFMGKAWDSTGIAYSVELWRECLRVLKPGGHLLAFGGSRTWHRLAVAIEDAGFELRDSIAWLYGSGFPKSLNIGKAIDKAAGVDREVVTDVVEDLFGEREVPREREAYGIGKHHYAFNGHADGAMARETLPATPDAEKWQGWGTALKPAFEPVVVGRKPLVDTVAANVLAWGVGGLNIDVSRIGTETVGWQGAGRDGDSVTAGASQGGEQGGYNFGEGNPRPVQGRWPANIILDEYTAGLLDEQAPNTGSWAKAGRSEKTWEKPTETFLGGLQKDDGSHYGDMGGASRFFYVAKASKRDRNEGLDELPTIRASALGYDIGLGEAGEGMFKDRNPQKQNFHPTVKPTDLMRYLIKLVTPAGGIVLDPFTGSGSTGKAALLDGYQFVGIEMTADYLPIIKGRLEWAENEYLSAAEKENETLF
jgi:site-specific DNA-methyltransferase (adenine-specific)